jgi:hypothetical protein
VIWGWKNSLPRISQSRTQLADLYRYIPASYEEMDYCIYNYTRDRSSYRDSPSRAGSVWYFLCTYWKSVLGQSNHRTDSRRGFVGSGRYVKINLPRSIKSVSRYYVINNTIMKIRFRVMAGNNIWWKTTIFWWFRRSFNEQKMYCYCFCWLILKVTAL